jgi:hypothetical protein
MNVSTRPAPSTVDRLGQHTPALHHLASCTHVRSFAARSACASVSCSASAAWRSASCSSFSSRSRASSSLTKIWLT